MKQLLNHNETCVSQRFLHTLFLKKTPTTRWAAGILVYMCASVLDVLDSQLLFFKASGFRGFNAEQNDGRAHILHEIFVNKKLPEDLWEVRFFVETDVVFRLMLNFWLHLQSFIFLIACKYQFILMVFLMFFFLSASGEKKKSTYFSPGEAGPVEEFLESEQ